MCLLHEDPTVDRDSKEHASARDQSQAIEKQAGVWA
jgi:hypothetical protein